MTPFRRRSRPASAPDPVIADLIANAPHLFELYGKDDGFLSMIEAICEAIRALNDPACSKTDATVAAKHAARCIAPYQQDWFETQKELAALRARDLRPIEQRPRTVFEDAPQDPGTIGLDEMMKRTLRFLHPSEANRAYAVRDFVARAAEEEFRDPSKRDRGVFIRPEKLAGWPSSWERLVSRQASARRMAMCRRIADALGSDWTEAKKTRVDNMRIQQLEIRMARQESLLGFIDSYRKGMDELVREGRIEEIRESVRARASKRSRSIGNSDPVRQDRTVVDLDARRRAREMGR
ncbi:hypothetical protein [Magnetospirillum sp. ME-1]|uniref:hypothetical protein n=1 Tax=Magnetospirillum sp. ME-1 TaxID=1639348 RepID=UPI0011AE41A5|nr:hypothetical protein [Magnetospirillum sp. ME-1]